jgi:uncharacterized protein
MKEMYVNQIGVVAGGQPFVLLSDVTKSEVMPIFVGAAEAASITMALNKVKVGRPLTHDLLVDVVRSTGHRVLRLEICDLLNDAYHARLCIGADNGEIITIDCRPSDGIAVALRTGVPILVDSTLATRQLITMSAPDAKEAKERPPEVSKEEFSQFLSTVKASDFVLPHLKNETSTELDTLFTEDSDTQEDDQPQ